MQQYVPGSDIEVGDEIRHVGDGGVWSKVIKLLTNGVELDGGILYFTEYKNITGHRKGGIDTASSEKGLQPVKNPPPTPKCKPYKGEETMFGNREAIKAKMKDAIEGPPKVDPSTFEIGDEVSPSPCCWMTIGRLLSDRVEIAGGDYTIMHCDILEHWKQQAESGFSPIAAKPDNDPVNHPSHYTNHPSGVQCIDITKHMGFCLGNAMKYIWRADLKEDAIEDLQKAVFYLNKEIETREAAELLEADI